MLFERAQSAASGLASSISSSVNPKLSASKLSRREAGNDIEKARLTDDSKTHGSSTGDGKWDARLTHAVPHDNVYYGKCMVGGALSCGLTHTAVTPLDVTKCNMQVNPEKYKDLLSGLDILIKEGGVGAIWKGWFPTLIGYSMQGLFKFGLYEYFKDMYSNMAGKEYASKYKGLIYCLGSASAELFADIALCPMEMVKVKVQTSSGPEPVTFGGVLAEMIGNPSASQFPFGSLVMLWCRQIPYTVAKFYFFEKAVAFFYANVFTEPRESYSKKAQLGITFLSGYTAGIVCAVVSHPADSIISLMGKGGQSWLDIVAHVGFVTLLTRGLITRILMIGTLTGLQWWIYDTFKTASGLGTSGG